MTESSKICKVTFRGNNWGCQLWDTPRCLKSICSMPDEAVVILVDTFYRTSRWIRVVYEDKIGWLNLLGVEKIETIREEEGGNLVFEENKELTYKVWDRKV